MIRDARFWVWLSGGAVVLAVAVGFAIGSYSAIDEELTRVVLSRRSGVAYLAATTLSEKFDRLSDIATALATRVRFRQLVAAGGWSDAIKILGTVPQDLPFIDRIELFDRAGTLMQAVPPSAERGASFAHLDWYRGVSAGWQPYVSEAYRRSASPQVDVLAVAVPIAGRQDDVAGILVLQLRLDRFFGWVERIDSSNGETVFVVDHAGRLAFHPRHPAEGALADFGAAPGVARALAGRAGVEVAYSALDGEDVVAAYVPVDRGWAVIAQQPARLAFAQRELLLRLLRSAYVLAGLLCIGAAVLAARIVAERRRAGEEKRVKAQLEHRVAERTAQLEAANRELEAFSYSVAHDLRSPLRAIDGFSRILLDEHAGKLPPDAQRHLGLVRANARQMARLIDDLLRFSRLAREPVHRGQVDMADLARRCAEELQGQAQGAERAAAVAVGELPAASADAAMLRQVWMNLISNALKYTRGKADAAVRIGFRALVEGPGAYYVSDNGIGFDMAYADKLFGVFQRLHRSEDYEGTGVGLAIVAQIVQRHGGRVWAQAEPGKGATFYFTLGGSA